MERVEPEEGWEEDEAFWSVYRQILGLEGSLLDGLASSQEEKERFIPLLEAAELKRLREQAQLTRVPYQPDGEPDLEKLRVHLHWAAALALCLKKRDGYSEDVRDWLSEAWHAARSFFGGERDPCWLDDWDSEHSSYPFEHSCAAVAAIVLLELFRVDAIDGNYPEALHKLALALWWTRNVFQAVPEEQDDLCVGSGSGVELLRKYLSYVPALDLEAQEAAAVFENLRVSSAPADWRQVAQDCQNVADCWAYCLRDDQEVVKDAAGGEWEWRDYWLRAAGYAMAKLEPDELAAYLEQERRRREDERAEEILATFFFQHVPLHSLPKQAKEGLIQAVKAWAWTKVGRLESVLNELRIATEALLYPILWEPVSQAEKYVKDDRPRAFRELAKKLAEKGQKPSLAHYGEMLRNEWVKHYIEGETKYQDDRQFMRQKLSGALRELRQKRGEAEHELSKVWSRHEIAPLFNQFMGVGQEGILPRLAHLYVKVAQPATRRLPGGRGDRSTT